MVLQLSQILTHDGAAASILAGPRSGDGDTASGGGRSRAGRHDESERGAEASDDDGDVEESKVDNENTRRGPLSAVSGVRTNVARLWLRCPNI